MATETLRPDDAGDETNLSIGGTVPAATNWESVDEAVADDDTTRVQTNASGRDLYNLPASSGSGVISKITVYAKCKSNQSAGYAGVGIAIKSNSTITEDTKQATTTSWANYSKQWATNPADGAAWEWADIDALQIGVALYAEGGVGWYTYCTQVYVVVSYAGANTITASVSLGLSPSVSKAGVYARSSAAVLELRAAVEAEGDSFTYLCVASQDNSIKTSNSLGASWTNCAKDAGGALAASHFAQYLNRLCVIAYQKMGFSYSAVNDIETNWTEKPNFPNLPQKFTDLFVGRDAGDDPTLYFLTPTGLYYLDVFTNFVFGPTEVTWEYDSASGKKGMYWKGDNYIAVGKGIYKISQGVVSLVGPDMDDGLPEDLQGTITDMIGVGFWLVISIDGGASNKSSILKRYITGNHWHPVYVGSANTPISALCWDSGTLYFGEGTNVKSLPFSNKTENVAKLSTHTYCASGDLIYPYFHSQFEAMPKVAHKVRGVTQDCDSDDKITIYYRVDEETGWTELGSFITSPRPTALPFPASGDSIGVEFERIQFKASFAQGSEITTNSPKLESLTLEYRVIPPVLWGWNVRVLATTSGDRRGEDIINALITAIEEEKLLSFYPSGDKGKTEYFVEIKGMPSARKGTEFGEEGVYNLTVQEVID